MANQEDKTRRSTFCKVFFSLLLDLLGFTVILPLLPSILDYYGQQKNDKTYYIFLQMSNWLRKIVGAPDTPRWNSVLFGGILGSLFSLLQFISSPILGALSDVVGRRKVLLLTMVGTALSYLLWASASSFSLFVAARILGGLAKGNVGVATAAVCDVSDRKTRGSGMALIGIAYSLAFLVGPMAGAYFSVAFHASSNAFFVWPATFAFTLAFCDIIFLLLTFKETLRQPAESLATCMTEARHLISPSSLFCFSALRNVSPASRANSVRIGLTHFFYLLIFSGLEFTLVFLVHLRFHYTSMQQGKMFLFMGCIMLLVQGGYVRRLKVGSEKKVAFYGMVLLVPALILLGYATSQSLFYVGLAVFSITSSTVVPCLTTYLSLLNTAQEQGKAIGIFRSLGALARALGPFLASAAYWSVGASVTYSIGAVSLIVPLLLLKRCPQIQANMSCDNDSIFKRKE